MTTAERVRAFIADCTLGDSAAGALGDVMLHPHQRDGLARVRRLLAEHGGALLADDVGLGKTYVALAAARDAARVLVIAPASLRDAWIASAASAHVSIAFVSVQSLSRGAPSARFDLVIVDEAHHLRSTKARRFSTAIDVCRDARVLLLTATPIQNRIDDLRAVLSLFLGRRAWSLHAQSLSAFVVRRLEGDLAGSGGPALPAVEPPVSLPPIDDVDCLDRLTALPPPLPPADGGDGGVLLTYSLVRQWSSSRAALLGALRRRLARAHAMQDALRAGRRPTAAELLAWSTDADTQQLAFPELVVACGTTDAQQLLEQVGRHADAVRDLVAWLRCAPDADAVRAATLAMLRGRHPGERIVAFSEFTDTVTALYRALEASGRVALLTHAGARVAGGRMTRRDLPPQ